MAPNHGGDPLGSILEPMGSHWVQKMGQNRKKCPKIRLYPYGAKSRWGPHRVHFGANGSHWVKNWVQTVKNYHTPKIEFSTKPRLSISNKIRLYGYGGKSRCSPLRVHVGANGVPLGQKMGQNRRILPCPKIRIFDYPSVIDFDQNSTVSLWRQITVGTP